MHYLLTTIVIFAAGFVGMTALCFASEKYKKQRSQHRYLKFKPLFFSIAGWGFLTVALLYGIQLWGISIGIAAWFGLLSMIVGVLILLLSYHSPVLEKLVMLNVLLSVLCPYILLII